MEFRILGPLEVRDGSRELPLRRERQKALLAILLLHASHVVPSGRLSDDLWPGEPPESGPAAIRVRISQLRKRLDESTSRSRLVTRAPGSLILDHMFDGFRSGRTETVVPEGVRRRQ